MRPLDGPLLAVAAGALALRVGTTDLVFRYLRPGMRPWLVLAGAVLVALGTTSGVVTWRHRHRPSEGDGAVGHEQVGHGHDERIEPHAHGASWLCWLLLAPVLLGAIVDPRALGAASVQANAGRRVPFSEGFDLQQYVATHSSGGQAPQLTLAQFIGASRQESSRALLRTQPVTLLGFATVDPKDPNRRLLGRLQLGCCAADAVGLVVEVDTRGMATSWPAANQWMEITGVIDVPTSDRLFAAYGPDHLGLAAITARDLREVDAPTEPYEYP